MGKEAAWQLILSRYNTEDYVFVIIRSFGGNIERQLGKQHFPNIVKQVLYSISGMQVV